MLGDEFGELRALYVGGLQLWRSVKGVISKDIATAGRRYSYYCITSLETSFMWTFTASRVCLLHKNESKH